MIQHTEATNLKNIELANERRVSETHELLVMVRNLSGQFVDDHTDRQPDGEPVVITWRYGTGAVDVEGNAAQLHSLFADAVFYADRWGPDECPAGLKSSAKRIARRLDALGYGTR